MHRLFAVLFRLPFLPAHAPGQILFFTTFIIQPMNNIITSILIILAAFFLPDTASAQTDSLKKAVITVSNLHCNNDMPTIKKQLLNQDGIEEVDFTSIAGTSSVFTISYHSSAISQEQIERSIESTPGCDDKSEMPYKVKKEGNRKKKKA